MQHPARQIAKLDPPFVMGDPNLHDGTLLSLALTEGGVEIGCEDIDGAKHRLRLANLVTMQADDFRQGNIILDVFVYVGADCPRSAISRAYGLAEGELRDWTDAIVGQVEREGWSLVVVESSYGCRLAALGKGPVSIVTHKAAGA